MYYNCKDNGIYHCVCSGSELFSSETKYDSGPGWPSFWKPKVETIKTRIDDNFGMQRLEVLCKKCDAHLGHVFEDDPQPTGLRYYLNLPVLTHGVLFRDKFSFFKTGERLDPIKLKHISNDN